MWLGRLNLGHGKPSKNSDLEELQDHEGCPKESSARNSGDNVNFSGDFVTVFATAKHFIKTGHLSLHVRVGEPK